MKIVPIRTLAVLLMAIPFSVGQESPKGTEFAKNCGVNVERASDGVFAKVGGKDWAYFEKVKAVPKFEDDAGQMAQFWRGEKGSFVQMMRVERGFSMYYEYCFGEHGKLARLNYEVRSPYDWGFARTNKVDDDGELVGITQRFFGLKTGRNMLPPENARDAQWALYPKVYKKFDKLPFAKLITKPVEPKKEDAQAH